MKRIFDLLFSIIVLVLFLPIGVLIASLIVLDSKGVRFRSLRQREALSGKLHSTAW